MALRLFVMATAALACSGAAAAATIDEFAGICLPARSASEATVKARAAGFVAAPAEIREKAKGFPGGGDVLWRADEGRMLLFISASVKRDLPGSASQAMSGGLCAVASIPPQPDLQPAIERLLDVGPIQPVGKSPGYVFEQTTAGRVRLDAADKALMGVKTVKGSVRIVGVLNRPGMNGIMMMTPGVGAK